MSLQHIIFKRLLILTTNTLGIQSGRLITSRCSVANIAAVTINYTLQQMIVFLIGFYYLLQQTSDSYRARHAGCVLTLVGQLKCTFDIHIVTFLILLQKNKSQPHDNMSEH